MDWKSLFRALSNAFAWLSALLIVLPLCFLLWGLYIVGCQIRRWIKRGSCTSDATMASNQLSTNAAESHEEGNNMATQPIQEAPGAQPELPQPVHTPPEPQFAAWWADLEEVAKQYGATFSLQQARALYERTTRTPAPVQQELGEREVQG